jgi:hypothetical protein
MYVLQQAQHFPASYPVLRGIAALCVLMRDQFPIYHKRLSILWHHCTPLHTLAICAAQRSVTGMRMAHLDSGSPGDPDRTIKRP